MIINYISLINNWWCNKLQAIPFDINSYKWFINECIKYLTFNTNIINKLLISLHYQLYPIIDINKASEAKNIANKLYKTDEI